MSAASVSVIDQVAVRTRDDAEPAFKALVDAHTRPAATDKLDTPTATGGGVGAGATGVTGSAGAGVGVSAGGGRG